MNFLSCSQNLSYEKFEDTEGIIRSRESKIKTIQWPKIKTIQWPKIKTIQWPKVKTIQWSKVKTIQWPKVKPIQWPKVKPIQWPKVKPIQWPKVKPIQWPKVKTIQWPNEEMNKRQTMNDKIHKLNIGTFAPLVLPEVLHGDFLSEIKYLFNLEGNILHILTRNVIFFYAYSN